MILKFHPVCRSAALMAMLVAPLAQAQSTQASPNQFGDRQQGQFGDRQAGQFGDIDQGAFGDTASGSFAANNFRRDQEGNVKSVTAVPVRRDGTSPPPGQAPYVTLKKPADPAQAKPAGKKP